ncbi:hypothetical protein MMC19_006442 [Ptychographa xylographoides]|nr:hypothetical protein [Ptychographa xylographoides]
MPNVSEKRQFSASADLSRKGVTHISDDRPVSQVNIFRIPYLPISWGIRLISRLTSTIDNNISCFFGIKESSQDDIEEKKHNKFRGEHMQYRFRWHKGLHRILSNESRTRLATLGRRTVSTLANNHTEDLRHDVTGHPEGECYEHAHSKRKPLGTGAFIKPRVSRWSPRTFVSLKRNKWSQDIKRFGADAALGLSNPQTIKWTTRFARLRGAYTIRLQPKVDLRHKITSPNKADVPHTMDPRELQSTSIWSSKSPEYKARNWRTFLLHTLATNPREALSIINQELKGKASLIPGYAIEDSLDYIAASCLQNTFPVPRGFADKICATTCMYVATYSRIYRGVYPTQRTIYLLSRHCRTEQVSQLVECLQKHNVWTNTDTKLHLMNHLAKMGQVGKALSLLQSLPAPHLSWDKVQCFCVMILRVEMEVEDIYTVRCNILALMLEAGVRPNRFLANIIILNAMEAGDLNMAWRSHEIAKENGLTPDALTYQALLKGVQHGDTKNSLKHIYSSAEDDGTLAASSRLRFELLYAIYALDILESSSPKPFTTLLPTYRRFFHTDPLQKLGIFTRAHHSIKDGLDPQDPSVHTLGLMVLAWLHQHFANGCVLEVYSKYMHYVREGHGIIAQSAGTTHILNAFIIAFGKIARTLPMCTQVVQDMMKPYAATNALPPDDSNQSQASRGMNGTTTVAPPDVQSWSILLFAFIRNRQSAASEKVLAIMMAQKMTPNQVTWNSLLSGYATMQDLPGVSWTMERMEKAEFQGNERTIQILGRVRNSNVLLGMLKEQAESGPQVQRRQPEMAVDDGVHRQDPSFDRRSRRKNRLMRSVSWS